MSFLLTRPGEGLSRVCYTPLWPRNHRPRDDHAGDEGRGGREQPQHGAQQVLRVAETAHGSVVRIFAPAPRGCHRCLGQQETVCSVRKKPGARALTRIEESIPERCAPPAIG
jgi:hypothetical protein